MVRMPWVTYLWPGLPQLWRHGLWWGLALAVSFGVLLNLLLMASLVWVEWLGRGGLWLGWIALGTLWFGALIASAWHGWGVVPRVTGSAEAMFRTALGEYLKGNWFEAERVLTGLLEMRPRDAEARLLLATLLRHNARYGEAAQQLDRLELLQDASRWTLEIGVERQAIAEGIENPGPANSGRAEPDEPDDSLVAAPPQAA